jgi:LuxR family maltose regulon positive regulatory protein
VAIQLLQTKIQIPPARIDLVSRPRLIELLDTSPDKELTLISAPAGYGKTTLVAQWLAGKSDKNAAWLSLDRRDNDPAQFFTYFIATLQVLNPEIGREAQHILQSPQMVALETLMALLIDDLMTFVYKRIVCVLDDFHNLDDESIQDILRFMLSQVGLPISLIVTTRVVPPLGISRLRARGQLLEINQADLRFQEEETSQFLSEHMKLSLKPEESKLLGERTEGWVAALQLAALSVQRTDNAVDLINRFAGEDRFIVDYLSTEILENQPPEIREFLLKTSILEQMNGALCSTLTGHRDGQLMLKWLESNNLFLIPLDRKRNWFRYHHLFSEFLRRRLNSEMSAENIVDLYLLAALWYQQENMFDEAIGYYFAAGDFDNAADLVERIAHRVMYETGEVHSLQSWLARLPQAIINSRPKLLITQAWMQLWTNQFPAVKSTLDNLEISSGYDRKSQDFAAQVACIRALLASIQDDADSAIAYAEKCLNLLPDDDRRIRGLALSALGNGFRIKGDVRSASQIYADATAIVEQFGQLVPALVLFGLQSEINIEQGKLNRADRTCRRALNLAQENKAVNLPAIGRVYASLGKLNYERCELDIATDHLQHAIDLCLGWPGFADDAIYSMIVLAAVYRSQHKYEAAKELLGQAKLLGQQNDLQSWLEQVDIAFVNLWLLENDHNQVFSWLDGRDQAIESGSDPSPYVQELETILKVRLLMTQNKMTEAHNFLTELIANAEAAGRGAQLIESYILKALILYQMGRKDQSVLVLGGALSLAEAEGFVRVFLDEGDYMYMMLQLAAGKGVNKPFVSRLLSHFEARGDLSGASSSYITQQQPIAEPLTAREQEVLQLMASGLSNPEIAQSLYIAVSTVKTHVKNIFGKLQVENRFQAIEKARTLKLI